MNAVYTLNEIEVVAIGSELANIVADKTLAALDEANVAHKLQVAGLLYGLAILLNRDESSDDERETAPDLFTLFYDMVKDGA